jgi:uncharacterized protein (DUF3084 family)
LEATSQRQGRELSEQRIARNTAETRAVELDRQLQALQGDIKNDRAKRDEAENGRRAAESALSAAQAQLARVTEQEAGLTQRLADLQARHVDELSRAGAGSVAVSIDGNPSHA